MSQTTLDDVFIHFASEQSEDIGVDHTHRSHPQAEDPEATRVAATSDTSDKLPDVVPPGNGSRKLTTIGGIIRYTKLREDIGDNDIAESDHHEP